MRQDEERRPEERPPEIGPPADDPRYIDEADRLRFEHEIMTTTGLRCTTLTPPDFTKLKPQATGEGAPLNLLNRLLGAISSIEDKLSKDQRNQEQGYNFTSVDTVTAVGREATSKHGVVFLVGPVRRSLEPITFRNGGKGRRLTIVFQATALNADDPTDRTTWEIEVANDGMGDKGHQVCLSIARKYGLIELLQLPRGNEDDAEAQSHPGLGNGTGESAVTEGAIADLLKSGDREGAEKMLKKAHAAVASAGEITEPKSNRLYAIARENNWTPDELEATCERLLGVSPRAGKKSQTFLPVSWKAYDLVVAFFEVPPARAMPRQQQEPPHDQRTPGFHEQPPPQQAPPPQVDPPSNGDDEWTWDSVWSAIRDAKQQLPQQFRPIGEGVNHALEALASSSAWTGPDVALVLSTEIDMMPEDLPTQDVKSPPFFRMVMKAFHRFDPDDLPNVEPYNAGDGEQPSAAAVFDPAIFQSAGWLELDFDAKWKQLFALAKRANEEGTGEMDLPTGEDGRRLTAANYLTLVNRNHNGGRTSAQVQALISRHLLIGDPRDLPPAIHPIVLGILTDHPESDPVPQAPPHGWRQFTRDKLQKLAEDMGVPQPTEGSGKNGLVVNSDWVAAIDQRMREVGERATS